MAAILLALLGLVALATSIPSPTPPQNSSAFSDPPLLPNKPAADVEQFLRDMVNKINRYRLMHAVSPLGLSLDLTNKAELWAVKIANKDQEELNSNVTFGQAIYSSANAADIVNASVESWYNQIVHYRYYNPESQPQNNYFTQLVWKDTTDIGIGKATSGSQKTYIVAYFNPPAVHDMQSMLVQVHPVTGSGVGKNGPSTCTDDYQFFNNSCWKLFPGPRTWESAVHKCTQQYASLASVDSESENYFIKTLLTTAKLNFTWIGLGDHDNDGIYAWVDGTSHRFTRWDFIQTPAKGRQCIVLGLDFEWRYISCDRGQSFVCKRKLRDLTTYELVFRYMNKLWTDKLYSPQELRYQALKSHIENAIFETYRDADWFNGLDFRGFRLVVEHHIIAGFPVPPPTFPQPVPTDFSHPGHAILVIILVYMSCQFAVIVQPLCFVV
ncbi:uncharacterized protein LOC110233667 [Exaiptasia diaphana]|uniref:C-type lectin domain-containing protein n=1 Tax=Exaiptasia diaphana TaxID=2652724 RepID=A0A913WV96_EXADI|nr:uncharacterized protein LOC110233667 [Exaiptasia diaphana]XP_028513260.1 uncharacterized protein LOC110233667 [Exaiptasia diaphana]